NTIAGNRSRARIAAASDGKNERNDRRTGATGLRLEPGGGETRSGGSGSFLEWPGGQDAVDLLAVQRLALEQGPGQRMELFQVRVEELLRPRRGIHHDALDLGVDDDRRLLAVVLGTGDLATEEDVLLPLAEGERAHLVRHAPLSDHLARHLRGLLEVVAGARGLLLEHDLFGGAAAQEDGDLVDEEFLRVAVAIVGGQLHGQAEGPPARDDRHLVERIGAWKEIGDERVPTLVIRGGTLLRVGDDDRAP